MTLQCRGGIRTRRRALRVFQERDQRREITMHTGRFGRRYLDQPDLMLGADVVFHNQPVGTTKTGRREISLGQPPQAEGTNPKTARVASVGLVPEPPSALGDLSSLSLITAEQATAVRKLSVEVIEPIEARARLGCSEGVFASILKAGLVRPFQEACQLRWYFRPDVLALIDRILELPVGDVSDDSFSLTAAAQASKRSIGELLRMLVSHEVPMMRLGNGEPLLASVVLTRKTVSDRRCCRTHRLPGFTA